MSDSKPTPATDADVKASGGTEEKPPVTATAMQLIQAKAMAYDLIGDIQHLGDILQVLTSKPVLTDPFMHTYADLLSIVLKDDAVEGSIDGLLDRGHWLREESGPYRELVETLHATVKSKGLVWPAPTADQAESLMCAGSYARETSGYMPRTEYWYSASRSALERARHPQAGELRGRRGVVQDSDRIDEGSFRTYSGRGNPSTSLSQLTGNLGRLADARSTDDLDPGND